MPQHQHTPTNPLPQPPLLLTKRVTSFLSANLTPQIHTACLTTPSGNLLAHASTVSPARVLRRQAAVAASLWAMHNRPGYGREVEDALPSKSGEERDEGMTLSPRAITVQLEAGAGEEAGSGGSVVVIRGLRCGILFLVLAGLENAPAPTTQQDGEVGGNITPTGGSSTAGQTELGSPHPPTQDGTNVAGGASQAQLLSPAVLGSPQESILSSSTAAATTASHTTAGSSGGGAIKSAFVLGIRRQAEEIARCLDEKLGSLSVPEESVGGGWDVR